MQKLGIYLEKVMNWEAFGYQLLPEDKEHLVEVLNIIYFKSTVNREVFMYENIYVLNI